MGNPVSVGARANLSLVCVVSLECLSHAIGFSAYVRASQVLRWFSVWILVRWPELFEQDPHPKDAIEHPGETLKHPEKLIPPIPPIPPIP